MTACRYIVEARNAHMKSVWKIFNKVWVTIEIPSLMNDYRIEAAIINHYYPKIESNKNDAFEIASQMNNRNKDDNEFGKIINSSSFQTRVKRFERKSPDTIQFPTISKEELKEITLGNYQIKLIAPYLTEHLKKYEELQLFECPGELVNEFFSKLVNRTQTDSLKIYLINDMSSRFVKREKYRVYLLVDTKQKGSKAIMGYTCSCKHGNRVVGCCGHIIAVIAYLGHYKCDKENIKRVASKMNNYFVNFET